VPLQKQAPASRLFLTMEKAGIFFVRAYGILFLQNSLGAAFYQVEKMAWNCFFNSLILNDL
jgi:hypothetical protein